MRKRWRILAIGIVALLLAPCAFGGERVLLDGVATRVNENFITINDVMVRIEQIRRKWVSRYSAEELRAKIREAYDNALQGLIERQLMLDAYENQEGAIPEWAVDRRINETVHESFDDDYAALLEALANDRLTYELWREEIRKQLIVRTMRETHVRQRVTVSVRDVQERYNRDPQKYRAPDQVKVRMIVLKMPASGEERDATLRRARDLREQLVAGGDFAGAARLNSEGHRAEQGGDWGWIEPGILRPELRQTVTGTAVGQACKLVETEREIYLVKVEDRKEGTITRFEDVQQVIEKELRQAEAKRLYATWIASLKKEAYITIPDVDPFQR